MFIDFKDIEISDKPVIDHYLSMRHYENSEFTFSNMFIWRHTFNLKFAVIDDYLCVIGRFGENYHFLFPPLGKDEGNLDQVFNKVIEYYKAQGYPVIVKCVTEPMRILIEEAMPGFFRYERDPNNDDYVYRTSDLINLEGRKYHQKRNHISKFLKSYQYTYENITDNNIEECIIAEIEWMKRKDVTNSLQNEERAIMEALHNFHQLDLKGGAIRIDGKIQAFSLGELLNPEMAVIHIEKANTSYHGCYAMINQQFAENCWKDIPYINREEDMGIPGLRKAKRSYHPIKMVEKYTAYLAKE